MEAQRKYTRAGELEQAQMVLRHGTQRVALVGAVGRQAQEGGSIKAIKPYVINGY